jgi:hypothetical protein
MGHGPQAGHRLDRHEMHWTRGVIATRLLINPNVRK